MTLAPLIAVSLGGSLVVCLLAGRGGRARAVATLTGLVALVGVAGLAVGLPGGTPRTPLEGASTFDTLFATGGYLRTVALLWALDGLLVVGLAAVTAPAAGLPATVLVGIAAATIALSSVDPAVAALAAAAGGLAGLTLTALIPAHATDRSVLTAAREVRAAILGGTIVLIAIHLGSTVSGVVPTPSTPGIGEGTGVTGLIVAALVVGFVISSGIVPFHLRVPGLMDTGPVAAIPMLLAWSPLALGIAGLTALDRFVLPLGLPLDGERVVLIGLALLATAAAALAAWLHSDLRHVVGYLIVSELGLVALALAVLDPGAWAPARAWLLVLATSKAALGAWALAVEARFEARRLDDLRGWARRAPLLAGGLAISGLATFGLPGWTAWTARAELAELTGPGGPATIAWLIGWLTAPVYLRLLTTGLMRPLTRVADAPRERPSRPATWDRGGRRVADERTDAVRPAAAARLARTVVLLGDGLAANRAPLASGLVLVAAILAGLAASGMIGVAEAAAQPAPAVAVRAFD